MSKLRILAVDDSVVNLMTLEQELQNKYEVIPMSSGDRALRFVRREQPDLVLLDIQMPDMDGLETLRRMREMKNGVTVPVIFLTSTSDKFTVVEGMKLGIMDYIVKPFQTDDLHERIERALKRRGSIPIDNRELYKHIMELRELIRSDKLTQASAKAGELMGYRINEEISGRLRVVKSKLDAGDGSSARQMMTRIIQLVETKEGKKRVRSSDRVEVTVKLRCAIDALDQFQTVEALDKLGQVLHYELGDECRSLCERALERLRDYDDVEAEKLLHDALESV
jgi:CheY-like chemotaxis protein